MSMSNTTCHVVAVYLQSLWGCFIYILDHSCPKTISPQSRKARRERNFIRIPERGILIKVFAVFPLCPDGVTVPSGKGLIHSIFPLSGENTMNKILSALSGSRERSEPRKAGQARGKYYVLKGTFKKMEPGFRFNNGI